MLYLCATPIGNLKDVTLRVLEVLKTVELIACEDTRHTRVLLERYSIESRLVSFHDHNEEHRLATLLPILREGKDIAVVSDAGMPGLSDPGFTLVRACAAEGLPVTVLPGPSAVSTALVLAGLPADRFAFVGFLGPHQSQDAGATGGVRRHWSGGGGVRIATPGAGFGGGHRREVAGAADGRVS